MQKELELNRADISKRTLELARKQEGEGQGTHIPEDDLDIGNPEIVKIGNRYYYRADIKVVLWIPYRRNTFPVPTRFEPEHWKSADMSQEMRMAARAMLSTGNPTPPDTFPDYQSWSKFWQSSEYRGIYNLKLFICCPDQDSKEARDAGHKSGYTPAPADVDPNPPETLTKRLTDDHKDRQNVGSIVEGLMQGATGNELTHWLTFPVGDQYEDALDLIKELCPKTNESYSEGEQIFEHTKADDCVSGTVKFMVRVGKAHNLLNYLATGKLIGFQGGILTYKLCCDGKLKLSYKHSAIPSQRIYVNNRTVYDYDMLNAKVPWSQVEESYYGVSAGVLEGSKAALKRRLLEKVESPLNKNEQTETAIPRGDGCPSPIPDDWLFDSA